MPATRPPPQAKIEKKRADLERNQQRLRSLQQVRPAFMEEYEGLEVTLKQHYSAYLEKCAPPPPRRARAKFEACAQPRAFLPQREPVQRLLLLAQ